MQACILVWEKKRKENRLEEQTEEEDWYSEPYQTSQTKFNVLLTPVERVLF